MCQATGQCCPLRQNQLLSSLGVFPWFAHLNKAKRSIRDLSWEIKLSTMIANNSSHEAVTSSHTGMRQNGEKVLNFQTPWPALLVQYTGAVSCIEPDSWLITHAEWHSQAQNGNRTDHFCNSQEHTKSLLEMVPGSFELPGCVQGEHQLQRAKSMARKALTFSDHK